MSPDPNPQQAETFEPPGLREAQARLRAHPGYVEWLRIEAFSQTLNAVFGTNLRMLILLLRRATTDMNLQVQLVQNAARPDARNQFNAVLIQLLHNYVASTMTLVDHARRLRNNWTADLQTEFSERLAELVKNPEVPFIQGLRNFMLHRSLPFPAYTLHIADPGDEGPLTNMAIELSTEELLAWKGWTAEPKAFLRDQGETVALLPIIEKHGDLVFRFNAWVVNALGEANRKALSELNEIQVELNAILTGVDTDAARRLTDEVTRQRTEVSWPPPKGEFPFGLKPREPAPSDPES